MGWLRVATVLRGFWNLNQFAWVGLFEPLRDDPRFQDLP